jgi:hypothetical protein
MVAWDRVPRLCKLWCGLRLRRTGGASIACLTKDRSTCLLDQGMQKPSPTHCPPTLVRAMPCRSGFGTANHIVSALLFSHLPERASGDHHFAQDPAAKTALLQRDIDCFLNPDPDGVKIHGAARWQLLSNLGLYIIILRVHVNRLLDGHNMLNVTCRRVKRTLGIHSIRQMCCVLADDATDHQAARLATKQRCKRKWRVVSRRKQRARSSGPVMRPGPAVLSPARSCCRRRRGPARGVFGPRPRSASSFIVVNLNLTSYT